MWLNIVEGVAAVVMLGVAVKVIMFGAKQRLDMVIYGEKLLKVMCEQCREMRLWGLLVQDELCANIKSGLWGLASRKLDLLLLVIYYV